mmetsp:Transcript_4366/g.8517  ORF Transcript_4366/g.8517 Transcript_4366/m.8517 type:complete len:151 (+) Transcript_4366:122-574(+)
MSSSFCSVPTHPFLLDLSFSPSPTLSSRYVDTDPSTIIINLIGIAAPLSLAAVLALIQNAPLLVLAIPAGTARAASSPSLPTCRIAHYAIVVDVETGMPVVVELIPPIGAVVTYQLVAAALGESGQIALLVLVGFLVVAFVHIVVVEIYG